MINETRKKMLNAWWSRCNGERAGRAVRPSRERRVNNVTNNVINNKGFT